MGRRGALAGVPLWALGAVAAVAAVAWLAGGAIAGRQVAAALPSPPSEGVSAPVREAIVAADRAARPAPSAATAGALGIGLSRVPNGRPRRWPPTRWPPVSTVAIHAGPTWRRCCSKSAATTRPSPRSSRWSRPRRRTDWPGSGLVSWRSSAAGSTRRPRRTRAPVTPRRLRRSCRRGSHRARRCRSPPTRGSDWRASRSSGAKARRQPGSYRESSRPIRHSARRRRCCASSTAGAASSRPPPRRRSRRRTCRRPTPSWTRWWPHRPIPTCCSSTWAWPPGPATRRGASSCSDGRWPPIRRISTC